MLPLLLTSWNINSELCAMFCAGAGAKEYSVVSVAQNQIYEFFCNCLLRDLFEKCPTEFNCPIDGHLRCMPMNRNIGKFCTRQQNWPISRHFSVICELVTVPTDRKEAALVHLKFEVFCLVLESPAGASACAGPKKLAHVVRMARALQLFYCPVTFFAIQNCYLQQFTRGTTKFLPMNDLK